MKSSTQDKAEGTAKNTVGRIKEATGRAIGNPRLEAEGKIGRIDGQIQKTVGEIKQVLGN
ncbi:MAG: CsbD family protein [Candidatus Didemnitutus sp.]|nr:CsbD family protein [Candidatus Didemnitutus sp.]